MQKLVWDTSAILSFKDSDYPAPYWLWKDLKDGWIVGPYQNIIPTIAYFEYQASISRKMREGKKILRELYIIGENETIYTIDSELVEKSDLIIQSGAFNKLRGADLIFACIAKLENAKLVTLDGDFDAVAGEIEVLNLSGTSGRAGYEAAFQWNSGLTSD